MHIRIDLKSNCIGYALMPITMTDLPSCGAAYRPHPERVMRGFAGKADICPFYGERGARIRNERHWRNDD